MTTHNRRKLWIKPAILIFLLILLAGVFNTARQQNYFNPGIPNERTWQDWGLSLLWLSIGCWLVYLLSKMVRSWMLISDYSDGRVTMLVNRIVSAVGYVFVLTVGLHLLRVQIGSILVGGAVTGVMVGIAAQSTLANILAGFVLFALRPFAVGQTITTRTSLYSGMEYRGIVDDINWYHTILIDGEQRIVIPNSAILVSAITILSEKKRFVYTVPLPLPFHVECEEFQNQILELTEESAQFTIKQFGETTYTLEISFLNPIDTDSIRAAIFQVSQKVPFTN